MIFLPIVARELRVASRKRSTYWVRTGAGAVVIALGLWLFVVMQGQSPREIAQGLFYVLTGSAVAYGLLSGPRTTADSLSAEKREGTLGLLFLTDLKGYDVVLGKLMASSVNALYAVLAVLPMLAVPILMGGVTPGEFARLALLSLDALFFSLAAGICVSSFSRSANQAMLGTLLVVLFFTAVLPACGSLLVVMGKARMTNAAFLLPSVGFTYYSALDQVYRAGREPFLVSMVVVNLLGWLFLGVASAVLPRNWQDHPVGPRGRRWSEGWKMWTYGRPEERLAFRRRLLDQNAFFWLASRVRIKPALVWGFLGLVGCVWAWGLAKGRRAWLDPSMYFITGYGLSLVIRCWFAAEATRQLAEDRKSGSLELLLSTTLGVRDILHGQLLALSRQFLGPVLFVLGLESLFLAASLAGDVGGDRNSFIWIYAARMVMFILDLAALYWVGLWQGVSAKNQSRATSTTLAWVLVLPWVVIALVLLFIAIAGMEGVNPPEPGGYFFLALWFFCGLIIDVALAAGARHFLLTRFRLAAQERYVARRGFWKSLLGGK
ncbi:MAG TPA: ABC transporter permease subunit [Verrucomicrobiae bacterium]